MLDKIHTLSSWLLPRLCACCGLHSNDTNIDLCASCKINLPWINSGCYQCGLPITLGDESIICLKCQESQPPFDRVCALFSYQPPITKLVNSLKFGRQLSCGALFGQLLTDAITTQWYVDKPLPQLIVPTPLYIQRQRSRGYNQAAEISIPISTALNIPLGLDVCARIRHTKAQTSLNRAKRTRNLAAAFSANIHRKYTSVAIVDDVVTTGSTVRAVSVALQKAGVENIDVWCVCRA